MNYRVKVTDPTGLKFAEILKKKDVAWEEVKQMREKYGFGSWRPGHWAVFGGISSCFFEEAPDPKIWKSTGRKEWMPKRNIKAGKEIAKEFDALTIVEKSDLNMCIGFDGAPFKTIGFGYNKEYFGFIVGDDWEVEVPDDCEEILVSKYKEIFSK
jgi:hypothetical protein